jgi:hypothetical protein
MRQTHSKKDQTTNETTNGFEQISIINLGEDAAARSTSEKIKGSHAKRNSKQRHKVVPVLPGAHAHQEAQDIALLLAPKLLKVLVSAHCQTKK